MIEKIITYQYQGDSRRFISIGMNLEASNPAQKPFFIRKKILGLRNMQEKLAKLISLP